jgi:hypothetical protein
MNPLNEYGVSPYEAAAILVKEFRGYEKSLNIPKHIGYHYGGSDPAKVRNKKKIRRAMAKRSRKINRGKR